MRICFADRLGAGKQHVRESSQMTLTREKEIPLNLMPHLIMVLMMFVILFSRQRQRVLTPSIKSLSLMSAMRCLTQHGKLC